MKGSLVSGGRKKGLKEGGQKETKREAKKDEGGWDFFAKKPGGEKLMRSFVLRREKLEGKVLRNGKYGSVCEECGSVLGHGYRSKVKINVSRHDTTIFTGVTDFRGKKTQEGKRGIFFA